MSSERRSRIGWYFYDWANSAFATTVVTVFLGPYLTELAKAAAEENGLLPIGGLSINPSSYFPYLVSFSVVLQLLCLPLLAALADRSRWKKHSMIISAFVGSIATMGFYFTSGGRYLLAGGLFLLANLAFGASIVFYNSLLPYISTNDNRNKVSSIGWSLGYLGGGILLALNLVLFSNAARYGLSTGHAVRIALASAGIWWALFTLFPLFLTNIPFESQHVPQRNIVRTSFVQLKETFHGLKQYPQALLFLGAFLLYSDGVQTVITMSSQFGAEELGLPISTLTTVILMVQFIAFGGALFFNYVAKKIGTKKTILLSLMIWIVALVYAFAFLRNQTGFFVLAAVIATVLGGTQALSRSVFSQIIPKEKEAEYFSFYELSEKGTSWFGPLVFGLTIQFTGNYRFAILSLVIFFILGGLLLLRFDMKKALADVNLR